MQPIIFLLYGIISSWIYKGNYPQARTIFAVEEVRFAIWNQVIKTHFPYLEMRWMCFVLWSGLPASAVQSAPPSDYSHTNWSSLPMKGRCFVPGPKVAWINTVSLELIYTSWESHALFFKLLLSFQHCGRVQAEKWHSSKNFLHLI